MNSALCRPCGCHLGAPGRCVFGKLRQPGVPSRLLVRALESGIIEKGLTAQGQTWAGQEQSAPFLEMGMDTDLDFPLPSTCVFFPLGHPSIHPFIHSAKLTEALLWGGQGNAVTVHVCSCPPQTLRNQWVFKVLTPPWASVCARAGVSAEGTHMRGQRSSVL